MTVVTQRNNLLISTTTKSPMVLQLSSQLDNAKEAIVTGVNRYIEGLQTSLSSYQQMEDKTRGLVAGLPSKENALRSYARSFKIVEELYVFLLERKEEASICLHICPAKYKNFELWSFFFITNSPQGANNLPRSFATRAFNTFWYFVHNPFARHQNKYQR